MLLPKVFGRLILDRQLVDLWLSATPRRNSQGIEHRALSSRLFPLVLLNDQQALELHASCSATLTGCQYRNRLPSPCVAAEDFW